MDMDDDPIEQEVAVSRSGFFKSIANNWYHFSIVCIVLCIHFHERKASQIKTVCG